MAGPIKRHRRWSRQQVQAARARSICEKSNKVCFPSLLWCLKSNFSDNAYPELMISIFPTSHSFTTTISSHTFALAWFSDFSLISFWFMSRHFPIISGFLSSPTLSASIRPPPIRLRKWFSPHHRPSVLWLITISMLYRHLWWFYRFYAYAYADDSNGDSVENPFCRLHKNCHTFICDAERKHRIFSWRLNSIFLLWFFCLALSFKK